jgi:DNA-binding response OmpR family regulator
MPHLVVLAEDDDDLGTMIKIKLEKAHIQVVWKQNGSDALSAILAHKPALALLDVDMPGINGLELPKRIETAGDTQHIPVIMMSALGHEAYSGSALRRGASDFIVKPFFPADSLARVQRAIGSVHGPPTE